MDRMGHSWAQGRSARSIDDTPSRVKDAVSRVTFGIDQRDPQCALLAFLTDTISELHRSRVQQIVTKPNTTVLQHLILKLEPHAVLSALTSAFKFWTKVQKKDVKAFLREVISISKECSKYCT